MSEQAAPATRDIKVSIDIDASADQVWRTVTDPDHVSRWFAPIASGTTGLGGSLTVSWGGGAEWTSWIHEWDPPHRVRYSDTKAAEAIEQSEEEAAQTAAIGTEYRVEALDDGRTRLTLVNSGFSADPSWDDALHMMTNGWRFFAWNIKHCLERHPGTPRTMSSARPWVSGSREEVWDAVFGPDGVPTEPGAPFRLRIGDQVLEGTVVLSDRPWAFAGVVSSHDDGVVHVEMEGMGGDRWKIGVWISTYGVDEDRCKPIQAALDGMIARLFPNQE